MMACLRGRSRTKYTLLADNWTETGKKSGLPGHTGQGPQKISCTKLL